MENSSKFGRLLAISLLMTFGAFIVSVSMGSVGIGFTDVASILWNHMVGLGPGRAVDGNFDTIVMSIRLPRVLLAMLVGASLSISGAAMQGLIRNPLADSSTLGVSSGGSLGAVLFMALSGGMGSGFLSRFGITVSSILFSILSFVAIMSFARSVDKRLSGNTIILSGIVFTMMASSMVSFLIAISGDNLKSIIFWSMGSFSGKGMEYVLFMAPVTLICSVLIYGYRKELNAFSLGEDSARYLGVDTTSVRLRILVLVSILVGTSVSVSGSIAFVGLVIPHIVRIAIGPNHERLIPLTFLFGGSFMMVTDAICRVIISPSEMPIGVITSFIGSLIFIYLFQAMGRKPGEI